MKKIRVIVSASIFFAAGCSSSRPTLPVNQSNAATSKVVPYSEAENKVLTYCTGLTDTAWRVAHRKLGGATMAKVEADYLTNSPNPKVTSATVAKVYSESFTSPWEYSVGFFKECALNMGQISSERSKHAAYCMQNMMLAALAQQQRESGATKEKVYASLPLQGETPRSIVDVVYDVKKTRSVAMMDAWNSCISPITAWR